MKGMGDFFGLDIGTNAIRVVQLSPSGQNGWTLQHYGYVPVDSKIIKSDSVEARRKLAEHINTAIGQAGIKTRNVAIGLPSSKTFTTVIDVPKMPEQELKAAMKYQVDQYIPMAIDEAKVDWALLGSSLKDDAHYEIILTSTANSYAEERLELVESIGLNVIAAEPDPIAMVRALVQNAKADKARLIMDMGEVSTDIAIVYGDTPRLVRTIPTGIASLVKAAVQNLNVQEDQARQFILKFGLAPDRLEGQVLHAIETTLEGFSAEVEKSIKFFQTRYPNIPVSGMTLSGFAAVVPKLSEYMSSRSGVTAEVANPWSVITVSRGDRERLTPIASEFTTAIGLAQRRGDR